MPHPIAPPYCPTLLPLTLTLALTPTRTRLDALAPFARLSLRRQLPLEELLPMMEGLAHWPSIVSAYNRSRRRLLCVRNPRWRALPRGGRDPRCTRSPGCSEGACAGGPYNCTGILHGNSIFAPVIGSPSVQSLPMLMGVQQCLELIEQQEAALRVRVRVRVRDRVRVRVRVWVRVP